MELRHLRYFVAVAEELHFRRAAERLHIAQPPLSLQIAELERELGARLLDRRQGRSTRLTAAGKCFLDDARRILAATDQAAERARRAQHGTAGSLSVGMTSSMAYGIVPTLLRQHRVRYPDVQIRLAEMSTAVQEQALLERSIDLGFCYAPLEHSELASSGIHQETLLVAVAESHPLSAKRGIRLASLAREPLLCFPRHLSPGLFDLIASACRQGGLSFSVVQEATQLQTIIALVCAGLGVALVPETMSKLHRDGVTYRPIRDAMPRVETLVVWRASEASYAKRFLRLARGG